MNDIDSNERSAFNILADRIVIAISRDHGFNLPITAVSEGHRMLGILRSLDREKYVDFKDWTPNLFVAARTTLIIEIEKQISQANENLK